MAKWVIEKMEEQYIDEETGKIPWGVTNLDDPDFGMEIFSTKREAQAYKKEQERTEQ